jgi:hypothetical protein
VNTFFDPKIGGFPPILESLVDYYCTSILVSRIDPAERALAFATLALRSTSLTKSSAGSQSWTRRN